MVRYHEWSDVEILIGRSTLLWQTFNKTSFCLHSPLKYLIVVRFLIRESILVSLGNVIFPFRVNIKLFNWWHKNADVRPTCALLRENNWPLLGSPCSFLWYYWKARFISYGRSQFYEDFYEQDFIVDFTEKTPP